MGQMQRIVFVVFSERDEHAYRSMAPYYFPGSPDDDEGDSGVEETSGATPDLDTGSEDVRRDDNVAPETPVDDGTRAGNSEPTQSADSVEGKGGETGKDEDGKEKSDQKSLGKKRGSSTEPGTEASKVKPTRISLRIRSGSSEPKGSTSTGSGGGEAAKEFGTGNLSTVVHGDTIVDRAIDQTSKLSKDGEMIEMDKAADDMTSESAPPYTAASESFNDVTRGRTTGQQMSASKSASKGNAPVDGGKDADVEPNARLDEGPIPVADPPLRDATVTLRQLVNKLFDMDEDEVPGANPDITSSSARYQSLLSADRALGPSSSQTLIDVDEELGGLGDVSDMDAGSSMAHIEDLLQVDETGEGVEVDDADEEWVVVEEGDGEGKGKAKEGAKKRGDEKEE